MRRLLAVPLLAATLLLAGCIFVPVPVDGGDRPDDDRVDIPAPSCDEPAFLNAADTHYELGNCDEVTIEGQGISVEASDIGTLTIRGESVTVDAASIGELSIEGNGNVVTAITIGSSQVNGEDNVVETK